VDAAGVGQGGAGRAQRALKKRMRWGRPKEEANVLKTEGKPGRERRSLRRDKENPSVEGLMLLGRAVAEEHNDVDYVPQLPLVWPMDINHLRVHHMFLNLSMYISYLYQFLN
jgi:hypothetical protein